MFQKILLFITFFLFLHTFTFANQKVEDVFIDINGDYKYIEELQLLYDKGIIKPNLHNKFKPYELLTREEFVGILMETNCEQCIKPNTDYDLISMFQDKDVYYDVNNNSNYYYCINSADNKGYVQGYRAGTTCENGKTQEDQVPFCPYNTIILEEALAVVMRAGNILSKQQANNFVNQIYNGESYPDLSEDVKAKNTDGSIYDFYPYFYEAENSKIIEYNNLGEKTEYSLVEKKSNKYFPKKSINREEFLKIAVFALKNSNCIEPSNGDIAGEINIYAGNTCEQGDSQCNYETNFNTQNPIDLSGDVLTSCELGFSNDTGYKWVISNLTKNTETIVEGQYIDDRVFLESGKYKIDLYVTDLCDNSSKITKYISITGDDGDEFIASINKEYGDNFSVDFTSIVEGNTGEYTYLWDFGDGNTSNEQNPRHIYNESGIYDVTLTVIDKNGVEKQIPTTVSFIDTDFNVAIQTEETLIGESEFIKFHGLTNSNNPNLTYHWDFGDGNTSNQQDPLHNYAPGTYTVTLTVTDEHGNQKQVSTQITIGEGNFVINASVDTQIINTGLEAEFTPSVEGGTGPYTYNWDFGDGNNSNEEIPTHIYSEPGIYTVELTVTDSQGNTQTTYTQVIVFDSGMDTNISTNPSVENNGEFTFNPTVNGGVGPYTHSWDFGDGNTSNEQNPNHQYQEDGTYTVTLTTIDTNGTISITQTTLIVVTNSQSDFNINISADPISGYGPLISNLGVSTQGGTGPFEYHWDLGDGTTKTGKNINHTFFEQGTYTVTVTVTDAKGITKTENIIITVTQGISNIDSDQDGILDKDDKCPEISGKSENQGCPIFEETCLNDDDCNENSKCGINNNGISTCIPIAVKNNCEYNGESTVFGNVICNTCPCQNTLDFNATLRNCDVVFPAITSPDGSEIYSKGNYYQIKK